MRSPIPTPGRNRRLENLWRSLTGFVRRLFEGSQRPLTGQRRGIGAYALKTNRDRNYDLEIQEYPVRDSERARELIELNQYCPEVATAIDVVKGDAFSSADGDDQGFTIGDTLIDGSAIDAGMYKLGLDCIARCMPHSTAQMILERMLAYGDTFGELAIAPNFSQVNGLMILPTWEMFRQEDQGELFGFHQNRQLWEEKPEREFAPGKVIHWRYRRYNLYGRSLFAESLTDWAQLKRATQNFGDGCEALGVNPIIHEMPEGADSDYVQSYKAGQRDQRADGVVTDYYLLPGEQVRRMAATNPDIKPLADAVLLYRSRIIMRSRVPKYLLGMEGSGAQDISGQPALAYARFVNEVRGCFAEGLTQLLQTEFILHGYPEQMWRGIRIVFPKIVVSAVAGSDPNGDESNKPGIVDTEKLELLYRNR
jgi:hypothetical protein